MEAVALSSPPFPPPPHPYNFPIQLRMGRCRAFTIKSVNVSVPRSSPSLLYRRQSHSFLRPPPRVCVGVFSNYVYMSASQSDCCLCMFLFVCLCTSLCVRTASPSMSLPRL